MTRRLADLRKRFVDFVCLQDPLQAPLSRARSKDSATTRFDIAHCRCFAVT